MNELFQTKRKELLDAYAKNGVPFLATTRGLHSVAAVQFDVENQSAAGQVGYLVAHRGQILNFFNYAIGTPIPLAGNPAHIATEAETSLTSARRTTASADLSIEWITMGPKGIKESFTEAAAAPLFPDFVAGANPTASVMAALRGQAKMVDPFSQVIMPEVGASATLEHVLYQVVAPELTAKIEWDNADRTEKIGPCSQFVEGGGNSYLKANGEPSVNNRFRIPEGFLWAREGQPASDLTVICTLQNDIVVPFTPPASLLAAGFPLPTHVWLEISMRLGGMLLRVPGSN